MVTTVEPGVGLRRIATTRQVSPPSELARSALRKSGLAGAEQLQSIPSCSRHRQPLDEETLRASTRAGPDHRPAASTRAAIAQREYRAARRLPHIRPSRRLRAPSIQSPDPFKTLREAACRHARLSRLHSTAVPAPAVRGSTSSSRRDGSRPESSAHSSPRAGPASRSVRIRREAARCARSSPKARQECHAGGTNPRSQSPDVRASSIRRSPRPARESRRLTSAERRTSDAPRAATRASSETESWLASIVGGGPRRRRRETRIAAESRTAAA